MQWPAFVAAQWAELERFAAETRELPTVFVVGLVAGVGGHLYNARRWCTRGRILGLVPKEKLPTYNVFYEARTLRARRAGAGRSMHGGVPFGDLRLRASTSARSRSRCARTSGRPDGPMRRRCLLRRRAGREPLGLALPLGVVATRREMIATRAADNQCTVAYANRVGAQRRPDLRRRRLRQPERPARAGGAALPGGVRRAASSTWIARRGCAARTPPGATDWERFARASAPVPVHPQRRARPPTASRLRYPAPAGGSFFLPRAAPRRTLAARRASARTSSTRSRSASATTSRRPARSRASASRSRAGATRCSRLLVAWHALARIQRDDGSAAPPNAHARSTCRPATRRRDARRRAARSRASWACRSTWSPIDEAFERELEATRAMLERRRADADHRQNIQARLRGTAHVELGEQRAAGCSSRRAT